jgi:hypothetical protein
LTVRRSVSDVALLPRLTLPSLFCDSLLAGKAEPNSKSSSSGGSSEESTDGAPSNRVLGGHKAAIHNDSVPEESKEHSRQVLKDAGVEIDE